MLAVVDRVECRRVLETTVRGTPAEVVNGHPRYTSLFGELPEPVEDGVGAQGSAVGSAEDESGEWAAWVAVGAGP